MAKGRFLNDDTLPWGKVDVDTNELSPEETTQMSREVKYIGMDVHKEAIVIAVRNTRGYVVMESIVETKASSILQFIHGMQGELHVTWEEGTWAAWLYDLLKPQVHQVLVCKSTAQCLIKGGQQEYCWRTISRNERPPSPDHRKTKSWVRPAVFSSKTSEMRLSFPVDRRAAGSFEFRY